VSMLVELHVHIPNIYNCNEYRYVYRNMYESVNKNLLKKKSRETIALLYNTSRVYNNNISR